MKAFTAGTLMLSMATMVRANFHILEAESTTDKLAVPSNKYNCGGIDYALNNNDYVKGAIGGSYMSLRGDLCGVKDLDFYLQSDGSYKFYIAGGDGTVQGQCYHNEKSDGKITGCSSYFDIPFTEKFVCDSYICN